MWRRFWKKPLMNCSNIYINSNIPKSTFNISMKFHMIFAHSFIYSFFRYADILAGKIQQKVIAVQKIETTRKLLKNKIEQFKSEKASIQPLVGKLTEQTKMLQSKVNIVNFRKSNNKFNEYLKIKFCAVVNKMKFSIYNKIKFSWFFAGWRGYFKTIQKPSGESNGRIELLLKYFWFINLATESEMFWKSWKKCNTYFLY